MRKRGQVLGTPFIMIFALVVGGMILIGGLYYVYKLVTVAEQIDVSKQVNDFKAKVKTYYYLEEDNRKTVKISMPSKAKQICFYDPELTPPDDWKLPPTTGINYPSDISTNTFYQNFFKTYTSTTMFMLPTKEFKQAAFAIPYLTLESQAYNPICVRNNGEVVIISMGDHVELEATYT